MFILKALLTALAVTGVVIGSPMPAEKRQAAAIVSALGSLITDLVADVNAITTAAPGDVGTALTALNGTLTSAETDLSGLASVPLGILDPTILAALNSFGGALGDVTEALGTTEDDVPGTASTITTIIPNIGGTIEDVDDVVPGALALIETILVAGETVPADTATDIIEAILTYLESL